ncbi:hypothetical protein ACFS5M_07645 [Lacinutrix iliipiscaria]|uniref:Outer membrane protein beta-barrel domain-containing protein n=1 Tax=Lacinutrix iliipiscaria TaxID=1230532 RepID=A0ABW5WNV4_9FLAO
MKTQIHENNLQIIKKQIMSKTAFIALVFLSTLTFAQNKTDNNFNQQKGFLLEISLGGGIISLEDSEEIQTFDKAQGAFVFPDLKLGYRLNQKLALTAAMPGMIYEFQDNDRHFGGFIPSVQYWVKEKWWIHGGIGLAIDGPALYDIKDNVNDEWNFGCAVMASTGYEILKRKNITLNLQSKIVLGRAYLDGDMHRDAISLSAGIGINCL